MALSCVRSDNVSLSDKAAEQVILYIQENQLKKGDRLPNEKKLVEQLNVSRSTIREAMRSLSSRGIVVIRQGSGTYISNSPGVAADPLGLEFQYDKKKVTQDLLEIRIIMEPSIASLCAQRAKQEDIDEIWSLAKQVSQEIKARIDHTEADVALHCKIAECVGNDVLMVLLPEIIKGIRLFTEMLESRIIFDVIGDHERIAEAISQRDSEKAREAMLAHLLRNKYALEDYFKQL